MPKEKKVIFRFNELIEISDTIKKSFDNLTYQKIIKLHEYLISNMNPRFYPISVINDMLRRFHSLSELDPEQNMFPLLFFV